MDNLTGVLDNLFTNISKQQQIGSEPSLPRTSLTEQQFSGYMVRLWVVMTESYGHKWISAMGEEPNETWTEALRDLCVEEWIQAIKKLKESTNDWPPGLPEFKRWAGGSLSEAEAKQLAVEEWNNRPPTKYNPFVTPKTYDQLETERRNFIQSRVAAAAYEAKGGYRALSFTEPTIDPRRICQDEELN